MGFICFEVGVWLGVFLLVCVILFCFERGGYVEIICGHGSHHGSHHEEGSQLTKDINTKKLSININF